MSCMTLSLSAACDSNSRTMFATAVAVVSIAPTRRPAVVQGTCSGGNVPFTTCASSASIRSPRADGTPRRRATSRSIHPEMSAPAFRPRSRIPLVTVHVEEGFMENSARGRQQVSLARAGDPKQRNRCSRRDGPGVGIHDIDPSEPAGGGDASRSASSATIRVIVVESAAASAPYVAARCSCSSRELSMPRMNGPITPLMRLLVDRCDQEFAVAGKNIDNVFVARHERVLSEPQHARCERGCKSGKLPKRCRRQPPG